MFCDHCYRESGKRQSKELNTQEAKKMIQEMKNAGFHILIFSGGEPLMRKDIYELGEFASSIGIRPVLGSNGTLITNEVARSLKNSGFLAAGISLDSLDPSKYDSFRKLPGAFKLVVQGLENLYKEGVPFQIHTTVMKWNVDELQSITDFTIKMKAKAHHIFFLVPTGRGEMIEQQALDVDQYEKVLTQIVTQQPTCPIELKPTCAPQFMRIASLKNIKTRFSRGCLAGLSYCIVSPIGDVQPCAYLNIPLGNVREIPFDTIWKDNEDLKKLRTTDYMGKCGICEFKNICGGCRARAYYYKKNYMEEDTYCGYIPKKTR